MANTKLTVSLAIANADIIYGHRPGYSMEVRGGNLYSPTYDCSGFVGSCWKIRLFYGELPTTIIMAQYYPRYGFLLYPFSIGILRRGDILVWERHEMGPDGKILPGHTAMVYSINPIVLIESTGGIGVRKTGYYNCNWNHVLRGSDGIYIKKWLPYDGINDGFSKS